MWVYDLYVETHVRTQHHDGIFTRFTNLVDMAHFLGCRLFTWMKQTLDPLRSMREQTWIDDLPHETWVVFPVRYVNMFGKKKAGLCVQCTL